MEETKSTKKEILSEREREILTLKEKESLLKRKEVELREKENILNEKYMNGDEYELKIMGLQLNERMMKKKIDLEMKSYLNEMSKLKKNIQPEKIL